MTIGITHNAKRNEATRCSLIPIVATRQLHCSVASEKRCIIVLSYNRYRIEKESEKFLGYNGEVHQ